MVLEGYSDEPKKKGSIEQSSLFMGQFTAIVLLVQFLVQYFFSYALMIYAKVSIVETHPHLFKG